MSHNIFTKLNLRNCIEDIDIITWQTLCDLSPCWENIFIEIGGRIKRYKVGSVENIFLIKKLLITFQKTPCWSIKNIKPNRVSKSIPFSLFGLLNQN